MENKPTYTNLREQLKLLLIFNSIEYICNERKEIGAVNNFAMENVPADTVLELIAKLIYIKKHKNYVTDKFWIGCAVNLADAYSYRVKIETVYSAIAPPEEKPKPVPRQDQVIDDPPSPPELDLVEAWSNFMQFAKQILMTQRFEQLMNLKWLEKDQAIFIETKDEFLINFVKKYFFENHKVEVKVHE
jgi:hypothetical protein